MKYESETTAAGTRYTFANGVILSTNADASVGVVTTPRKGEVGTFDFPVRHVGDVFHAFRMGDATVANIPAACRAW